MIPRVSFTQLVTLLVFRDGKEHRAYDVGQAVESSYASIRPSLSALTNMRFIERLSDGVYSITARGQDFLIFNGIKDEADVGPQV